MGARAVNKHQQPKLVRLCLEEEVQAAIKGLNVEGVPSLNGLPVFFYSEFWGLVRSEVMGTLYEFQHKIGNMSKINRSHLFLLLKC